MRKSLGDVFNAFFRESERRDDLPGGLVITIHQSGNDFEQGIIADVAELTEDTLSSGAKRTLVPSLAKAMQRVELVAKMLHAGRRHAERRTGNGECRTPRLEAKPS